MPVQPQKTITPKAYLSMERTAETKSEFIDGEIFAMAGASRAHNQISANIVRVLGNQLIARDCQVYASDMKVKTDKTKYVYPDIVVSRREEFEDDGNDVLLNPILVMEILSDSTEAYDRGRKFAYYQRIPSFAEYVLVSQTDCRVEKFSRMADNKWIYSQRHGMEDVLKLERIGCDISIRELYGKVF